MIYRFCNEYLNAGWSQTQISSLSLFGFYHNIVFYKHIIGRFLSLGHAINSV